ncbi:hypothetical protein HMPREF9011_04524 [Bacteroides sp. 3_1_40A]|nr:hypothetical protein HMPREF9011_04524 [Bacteroides sp. 3_1_40A]
MAILSGNDDLLEKAKLDKKLAVLESERQAFHRNKGNAKGKLNERTSGIEKTMPLSGVSPGTGNISTRWPPQMRKPDSVPIP